MGFLFVFLSAGCSLIIAHLLKHSEQSKLRIFNVLTVNYAVAVIVAFGMRFLEKGFQWPQLPVWLIILIIITGFLFIFNFVIYSKSIDNNGVAVSISAMRVSLLIPVFTSILFFGEWFTWSKSIGIILVITSLFLLIYSRPNLVSHTIGNRFYLIILFLVTGLGDAALKIFQAMGSTYLDKSVFMGFVFTIAFIFGMIWSLRGEGDIIKPSEIKMGLYIGVPNLFSSIFLIKALDYTSGSFVFSLVNTLIVLGGVIIGKVFWDDTITRRQYWGISLAIFAIVLLWS